jgi:hypothetical protein
VFSSLDSRSPNYRDPEPAFCCSSILSGRIKPHHSKVMDSCRVPRNPAGMQPIRKNRTHLESYPMLGAWAAPKSWLPSPSWPTTSAGRGMLLGRLRTSSHCVCLAGFGVGDQMDEIVRPPPSGFVRAGSAQDLDYLYSRFVRIDVGDVPISTAGIDNALRRARRRGIDCECHVGVALDGQRVGTEIAG